LPPACPPGWQTGPPHFVGLGAQKAGSTWWFRLITAHPDVHMDEALRAELHFFDQFTQRWPTPADIARYHRFFPRPGGGITGEKTPEYLTEYWVPTMLREAAPDAKLVVLLRDPIERYRSAGALTHRAGDAADRDIEVDLFYRGLYGHHLARFLDVFPSEQVLALQYERCVQDPADELARTYRMLGLAPHALPPDELTRARNVTRAPKAEIHGARLRMLQSQYEPDVVALTKLVPDLDLALWPNFRHLA
jgi:hypothetical protein